jgi:hypothetical protein
MMLSLPKSRQSFWQTVRKDGNDAESLCVGEKIYFLPEAINVSHKIRTVSGCVEEFLPAKIKPLSVNAEKIIIETLMSEIEATHIIETDKNPNLDRCSGDAVFIDNADVGGRIFAIGASHITRLVGGLAECGLDVINLAKPGWQVTDGAVNELKSKLKNLNAGKNDILLLDPLSNNNVLRVGSGWQSSRAGKNK